MTDRNPNLFLLDTYDTERLKTLAVWSCFGEGDLRFRPARTPSGTHGTSVCVRGHVMRTMLEITTTLPTHPASEDRLSFMRHDAQASEARRNLLSERTSDWWAGDAAFFDVTRSSASIFLRRLTHSAHHRGQLTAYLRLLGRPLYSTYGPIADTGGLFLHHAPTLYRYTSLEHLLAAGETGGEWPPLPGPGAAPQQSAHDVID